MRSPFRSFYDGMRRRMYVLLGLMNVVVDGMVVGMVVEEGVEIEPLLNLLLLSLFLTGKIWTGFLVEQNLVVVE